MRRVPTGYDPNVGQPRFASGRNIGPPSLTRPNGFYAEADSFDQLKDLFFKPDGLVFHYIVPQGCLDSSRIALTILEPCTIATKFFWLLQKRILALILNTILDIFPVSLICNFFEESIFVSRIIMV